MTNDHSSPDADLLASTYLDGQVDDEARARAEADPDVMDLVERFRALRVTLAAVDAPDGTRRAAAIAAALGTSPAVGEPAADSAALRPPRPVARHRNRWMSTVVTAAAAVVLVAVAAGIFVVELGGGNDEDSAGAPTARNGAESAATMGADLALDTLAAADATAAAPAQAATEAGEAPAATLAAATVADAAEAGADTTAGAGGGASEGTVAATSALTVLRSGAELSTFAARARTAADERLEATCDPGADPDPSVASYADASFEFFGTASYVVADTATVVEVFVAGQTVLALDVATCALFTSAVP